MGATGPALERDESTAVSSSVDLPSSSHGAGMKPIGENNSTVRRRTGSFPPFPPDAAESNEAKGGSLPTEGDAKKARTGSGISPPTVFAPAAILDGSKLILRLARNDTFTMDNPCKLILGTPGMRLEHPVAWQTTGVAGMSENTVVIDCGLLGHRFFPIPLDHYGTLYTKDGTVHITVGTNVRRAKIHSRNLPYRACNKFHTVSVLEDETPEEEAVRSAAGWFLERQSTNKALASFDPSQAVKLMKQMASDPHSSVVYIRSDDSLIRYKLGTDEKIELHSGRLVAWTVGVRFEMTNRCCFRFVTAVHGAGTVWIQTARPRASAV